MTRTLDAFQHEVLDFFDRTRGRGIYADDMGGRKTATTLSWLQRTDIVRTVLVIVPKAVHVDHWLAEAEVWAPRFTRLRGMGPKRLASLHSHSDLRIYVTTYASARNDELDLRRAGFDTVVFDEGHALKGRTTQVAKMANQLAKATHCLIVTGTPVMNKPEEMWQYLHMLKPKEFRSYWAWAEEHFSIRFMSFDKSKPWNQTRVVDDYLPGHQEQVRTQLVDCIIQRGIEQLFPGEVWVEEPAFSTYPINMVDKELALYTQLVNKGWGKTPTGLITTKNAITVQTRLRQLSSDWGTLDAEYENSRKMRFATANVVEWHVKEDEKPVILFASYVVTTERLAAALEAVGMRAFPWNGSVTPADRALLLKDYAAGHVDAIVGTYAAMGEGTDGLQYRTNLMGLYDLDWVPGVVDQAIGRLKRSGQTERVQVRHYYYLNSIERAVLASNRRKINMVNYLKGKELSKVIYGHLDELRPRDYTDEILLEAT